jgi:predicted DNA-binding transcriptional regulator YafY
LRDISPHRLIFAGNRYHVRGYCHVTNDFFDFVLSRIDHAETSLTEWVADQDDEKWHRFVDLCFKPNEKLPPETYRALVYDYPLDDQNIYKVPCREALVLYVERELIATNPKYGYSLWVRVK